MSCLDAISEPERLLAFLRIDVAPGSADAEGRTNLVEAARGDAPVIESISADSLPAFREIQNQTCGGAPDLIEELRIAAADANAAPPQPSPHAASFTS